MTDQPTAVLSCVGETRAVKVPSPSYFEIFVVVSAFASTSNVFAVP